MICLKSLTFVVSITTAWAKHYVAASCDLLEKSYLCGINNNPQWLKHERQQVVICLKSLTFVVSITTHCVGSSFIIRCDLLEKSYLCGINNNIHLYPDRAGNVVICLKSLTFVVSITTPVRRLYQRLSCDLLEKSYLCGINNNEKGEAYNLKPVVICLKSLTFVVSITTTSVILLW